MSIGTTIKKLRRKRDMTQEELAQRLGITANAISQWECDRTAPDISQIPLLVHIFGVTADELLEIDASKRKQEIDLLHTQINKESRVGKHKEAFLLAQSAHRKFPNEYTLMYDYASHFCYIVHDPSFSDTEKQALREECFRLMETVAKDCTEEYLRQLAVQDLCGWYRDAGRIEDAEKIIDDLPLLWQSREFLYAGLYGGNKGIEKNQDLKRELFDMLSNRMVWNYQRDDGKMFYSPEEMCGLYEKRLLLLDLLFENRDFGFFDDDVTQAHCYLADYYATKKDEAKTLYHLEAQAESIRRYMSEFYKKDYVHTSLFLKEAESDGHGIFYSESENYAAQLLSCIKTEKFDFIREDPRLAKIEALVAPFAGVWE